MKDKIYIGEVFQEVLPSFSKLIVGDSTQTIDKYSNDTDKTVSQTIDTNNWKAGTYSVVLIADGKVTPTITTVINPLAQTDKLSEYQSILDDINTLITARILGDNSQVTINNKTLIREELSTLISMKNTYQKQVNEIRKSMKKDSSFFKSTIHCRFTR
ncbi:hypothetical protein SC206_19035 [Rouxiella sp. T17]|uniref:hypothetical protein n=1 Tax=Rouxiella sp. T17 TaxID=3085684 RepID=UPI002FC916F0